MSFWKFLGSGLPWFFGEDARECKRPNLGEGVLKYLHTTPLRFRADGGHWIYVLIDPSSIKKSATSIDEEVAFKFQLSKEPSQAPDAFRTPDANGFVVIRMPSGKTTSSDPVFAYTFSSLNTLEQNQANLEHFVQDRWQEMHAGGTT
jgi:hypothetical protein